MLRSASTIESWIRSNARQKKHFCLSVVWFDKKLDIYFRCWFFGVWARGLNTFSSMSQQLHWAQVNILIVWNFGYYIETCWHSNPLSIFMLVDVVIVYTVYWYCSLYGHVAAPNAIKQMNVVWSWKYLATCGDYSSIFLSPIYH